MAHGFFNVGASRLAIVFGVEYITVMQGLQKSNSGFHSRSKCFERFKRENGQRKTL